MTKDTVKDSIKSCYKVKQNAGGDEYNIWIFKKALHIFWKYLWVFLIAFFFTAWTLKWPSSEMMAHSTFKLRYITLNE